MSIISIINYLVIIILTVYFNYLLTPGVYSKLYFGKRLKVKKMCKILNSQFLEGFEPLIPLP